MSRQLQLSYFFYNAHRLRAPLWVIRRYARELGELREAKNKNNE